MRHGGGSLGREETRMTAHAGPQAGNHYLTDVAYLRTFSSNLAPPLLRAVAALNGFTPPPADDFDYCELGSGHGDTTATLAAAHPRARFLGVDVMAPHVDFAAGLARRGGLANVRFLERDFEDLRGEVLPAFDYLTAHGVWTWISPAKRKALLAFAQARLKPGGLLYVSYNALPGWAAAEPLRRLMVDGSAGGGDSMLERARRGVLLAKQLSDADAGYFKSNPAARMMLETMTSSGLPYVVHEYFTPHWHPMYFVDVAREMAAHGLYYVGQLPLHLNYGDLALRRALAELLKGVKDRIVFESLKDYALNEFFRREVYVKGTASRAASETETFLDGTPFGTLVEAAELPREVRLPHYTIKLDAPLFDTLLPALAERPTALAELARLPALASVGAARLREAALHLLLGSVIAPMTGSAPPAGTAPSAYNRMVLGQELTADGVVVLAAPVAGTGVVVSGLEAAAIQLLCVIEPAARSAFIEAWAARSGGDRGESARRLEQEVERVRVHRLPRLAQLGVVEPRG
jgi:SAM-dependent methyltransferase